MDYWSISLFFGDGRKMVDKNIRCSLDGYINKYILWTGDDEPMVGWWFILVLYHSWHICMLLSLSIRATRWSTTSKYMYVISIYDHFMSIPCHHEELVEIRWTEIWASPGFALMKLSPPRTAQARREFVRAVTSLGLQGEWRSKELDDWKTH